MSGRAGSDEHYVLDLCDDILGRPCVRQATFDWLRGDPSPARPRGAKLPVDGYWPELGLIVEFQEEQHSEPSPFFDRRETVSGVWPRRAAPPIRRAQARSRPQPRPAPGGD